MKVDVSLDLYRIFCAVVRTGNMSAAARELFISQPAVSMSIRQLEDRMGSPLLVRTAKGVYPTAEGDRRILVRRLCLNSSVDHFCIHDFSCSITNIIHLLNP